MRIIAKKILREFWEKHNDAEDQLKTWFKEASKGNWKTPMISKMNIQKPAY
jgi:mRNA interferase HigB